MPSIPPLPTRTLVLAAITANGSLDAEPLFSMASAAGHSDKAMRDSLSRVVSEGLLDHAGGRGRKATYTATAKGIAALDIELAWAGFAHRVDRGLETWDGTWHLVGFEIPERRRGARDALRNLLVEMGAAPLQSGMYAHAYRLADFVHPLSTHLDVGDEINYVTVAEMRVGKLRQPAAIASHLWDLDTRAKRYGELAEVLDGITRRAPSEDPNKLAATMLAATILAEEIHREDPLLPNELLPSDWAGVAARQAYLAAHEAVALHSSAYCHSQLGAALVNEINLAVSEESESFWARWGPRLFAAYQDRLPPSATAQMR